MTRKRGICRIHTRPTLVNAERIQISLDGGDWRLFQSQLVVVVGALFGLWSSAEERWIGRFQ